MVCACACACIVSILFEKVSLYRPFPLQKLVLANLDFGYLQSNISYFLSFFWGGGAEGGKGGLVESFTFVRSQRVSLV